MDIGIEQLPVRAVINEDGRTNRWFFNLMNKMKKLAAIAVSILALELGGQALAQPQGGFGGGPGGIDFQNMDPQQIVAMIQQRIDDSFRDQMGVTNDTDWALIEEKINAVEKARMSIMADGGGMMGMRGGGRGGMMQRFLGDPSTESQALQQAVDANAPPAQIEQLLARFEAVRKQKQAALEKAQDDLRSVLTTRQEGIAVLGGLLD